MIPSYLFQLSPLELHWLAAAFKITRLPLLDNPLRYTPNSELATQLKDGLASLESRGLVRQEASGLQVDELAAATVQWLGLSTDMLVLDHYVRDENAQHSQVFTRDGASMYVILERDQYQFVFLPDRVAVSDYLLKKIGGSFPDLKPASAKFTVSQLVTILRTTWTNTTLATNMLKVTGLKSGEINSTLAWFESLGWILTLNQVQLERKGTQSERQTILCGNMHECWTGHLNGEADGAVEFTPIEMKKVRTIIGSLL